SGCPSPLKVRMGGGASTSARTRGRTASLPHPRPLPAGEGGLRFAGYAALFGVADAGRDMIRRGAFARTLRERAEPLPLLWEHRPGQRIGVIERVAEDARGLRVIARVENLASRAARMLLARAVSGLSFGYRPDPALDAARARRVDMARGHRNAARRTDGSLSRRDRRHRAAGAAVGAGPARAGIVRS